MPPLLRVLATGFAAYVSWILIGVMLSLVLPDSTGAGRLMRVLALVAAAGAAWMVWRSTGDEDPSGRRALAHAVGTGALVVGGIGFAGGFFGPMVFAPEANQGPLLGIFITGPLGAVIGAIGGAVFWVRRR